METRLPPGTVSRLLAGIQAGDGAAREQLGELLLVELEAVAERLMQRERPGHTMQAGDLVQEVLIRLLQGDVLEKSHNRAYLFGAASTAMRRVLVEYARRRGAVRHGGEFERVAMLEDALDHYSSTNIDIIALHEALETLRSLNPRQCQIVDEYHFGGFTLREIGEHLGLSEASISLDLKRAQLWLGTRLHEKPE